MGSVNRKWQPGDRNWFEGPSKEQEDRWTFEDMQNREMEKRREECARLAAIHAKKEKEAALRAQGKEMQGMLEGGFIRSGPAALPQGRDLPGMTDWPAAPPQGMRGGGSLAYRTYKIFHPKTKVTYDQFKTWNQEQKIGNAPPPKGMGGGGKPRLGEHAYQRYKWRHPGTSYEKWSKMSWQGRMG